MGSYQIRQRLFQRCLQSIALRQCNLLLLMQPGILQFELAKPIIKNPF